MCTTLYLSTPEYLPLHLVMLLKVFCGLLKPSSYLDSRQLAVWSVGHIIGFSD